MQLFFCLCIVVSLKVVSSKSEPLNFSGKEEEFDSSILNNRRKLSNFDSGNFILKNLLDNMEMTNYEKPRINEFTHDYTRSSQPNEADLSELTTIFEKLLQQTGSWKAPVVIFEEPQQFEKSFDLPKFDNEPSLKKRSRYYRRYPWKRRNSSYDYGEEYYLCLPARREVIQLMVALHDARQGRMRGNVDFCKRRKSAKSVLTNIRFLGRRK